MIAKTEPTLPNTLRWVLAPLALLLGLAIIGIGLLGIIVVLAYPQLPSLDVLTNYQPKIPLRIYTSDGYLIGEFGEERRSVVKIGNVPEIMKHAILAAEDERFYQHPGIDTVGVLRAGYSNIVSGGKHQGASTITMQVARNFFLSSEKTIARKVYEALLAFKIEHSLGKDEILELYINQIYLGQHAYGFSAAAQSYFGKPLKDLTIAESAMLAGLPKGPSKNNPVANPKRAKQRQAYVLRRMRELNFISDDQFNQALLEAMHVKRDPNDYGLHADYVSEMARQIVVEKFGEESYNAGLQVVTTITKADQEAAYSGLREGVSDYDRRHGYRGAEGYLDMQDVDSEQEEQLEDLMSDIDDSDNLKPAIVLEAAILKLRTYVRGEGSVTLTGENLKFASRMLEEKAPANKRLRRGALVRVYRDPKGQWQISQLPEVESAFVAASPIDGSVRALVGGFDFNRNKFNHVTQAWRQPGSSFKPFIYSAGIEKGFNAASVFPDEPITVPAAETGSQAWEPKNYDGKYEGPITLRTALAKSKNMVSIRLLRSIGPGFAQSYITRFGFDPEKHPPFLTMALGAGSVTPWQQLAAYSIFANGGYQIRPFVVRQILDAKGKVLAQFDPPVAGDESLRVIDARNAYIMDSMMHDVTRRGTAARAGQALKRYDIAGKTGTTNDSIDAWFCGYHATLVAITWIGFDQPKSLGDHETGGGAALPIWIHFMEKALNGVPESYMEIPGGLTPISATDPSNKVPLHEYVYGEQLPTADDAVDPPPPREQPPAPIREATPKPVEKPN